MARESLEVELQSVVGEECDRRPPEINVAVDEDVQDTGRDGLSFGRSAQCHVDATAEVMGEK